MDTYFSKLNLKTLTLMYHFCHGDFRKSQKYSLFIIKISESKKLKNIMQDWQSMAVRSSENSG